MQCPQLAGTDLDVSVLCFGPRCVRRHGNLVGTAAAEMDTALVEDIHALWTNE